MNEHDLVCRQCKTPADSDKTTITERIIQPRWRVPRGVGGQVAYTPSTSRVSWVCHVCGCENEQVVYG